MEKANWIIDPKLILKDVTKLVIYAVQNNVGVDLLINIKVGLIAVSIFDEGGECKVYMFHDYSNDGRCCELILQIKREINNQKK